jgi:KUP system potassium uptake protein
VLTNAQVNIVDRDPREQSLVKMERVQTGELRGSAKSARKFFESHIAAKYFLRTVGVLGVAMVMSDGVLTPAQSVLGAIQGINIVAPNIGNPTIIGVSCAILVLLFLVQPFGTTKIASSFAPIVIVWLLFNFTFGIYVSRSILQAESVSVSQCTRSDLNRGACPFLKDRTKVQHPKMERWLTIF